MDAVAASGVAMEIIEVLAPETVAASASGPSVCAVGETEAGDAVTATKPRRPVK